MAKDDSSKEQEVLKQAKKINEAQRFAIKFGFLDHDKDVYLSGKDSPYPKVEKYYLLKDYKSIDDFKKTALSYYSKKEANDKFFKYSENEADWKISGGPFMIEKDSKVYADVMRFGISSELVYKADSVKVKSVEGNNAVITVDYYFAREPEIIEKKDFKMVKENGIWVFDEIVY